MKIYKGMNIKVIMILICFVVITACGGGNYTPLPRGYFRIDLPEHKYQTFDTTYPYSFEYPVYAVIDEFTYDPQKKYWINVRIPQFKATVYLSYKAVDNNLDTYLVDSYTLVSKHIPKADNIQDSIIINREKNIFGLVYQIEGSGAASPYQFFVTDSASHFLRGALYFDIVPNNDSLQPVIEFLTNDIKHIINTLEWNSNTNPL